MSSRFAIRSFRRTAIAMVLPLLLVACGGGSENDPPATPTAPTAPAVTLDATASAGQLLAGGATTLTAAVSDNSAVSWQLAAGAPGKLSATTGASVTYTAPASGIAVPTAVNVTATAAGVGKTVQLVINPAPGGAGLSLIAGALGSHTVVDGNGATARFDSISGIEAAANGSWLVIDNRALALRHVSAGGSTSTVVNLAVSTDGFGQFLGIAPATDGSIRAVQRLSTGAVLRRLALDGTITTIGSPTPELEGTRRLASSAGNDLFVLASSAAYSGIYRVSSTGTVTLLAGGTGGGTLSDGQGAAARFNSPTDMVRLPNGDFYVIDGQSVRHVTAAGRVTTLALTDVDLPADATLRSITARADGTLGLLVHTNSRYTVYGMTTGGALTPLSGGLRVLPAESGGLRKTDFVTLRAGPGSTLVVANGGELHTLQAALLEPLAGLEDDSLRDTDGLGTEARFVDPKFVASDQRGKIYVADHPTGYGDVPGSPTDHGLYLRQIDAAGQVTTLLTKDDFGRPRGLLADTAGNVYVLEQARWLGRLDRSGGAVYKIAPGGTMTLIAGQTEANDTRPIDGKGTQARFARPTFAGIAADGTLYVYDVDNTIRKVAQDGTVTTVAALPADVGVAPDGKRYDYDGETVGRIEADGSRTVVAGQKGKEGTLLGTLLGALPGALGATGGQASLPGLLTPTGLHTFALISNSAIVKLVLPH
ncbi:hypothetical protein ACFFTM_04030 [Pseudoduganella plicata]|uniref:Uncharacterized protein n=1 Tax=Pseudoduganella plicata TaxID=321984 RepID=A0A4V1ATU5_9BURK|nr:hypothetical protein [Pseudoduganella plicata]QBQ36888.1 hypothetical protein E1742_12470 [Pseudoduganella plicata]GGZ07342.1 hypothetical protein GCM10007388_46030 [Pseudoduganella plicata]